MEKKIYLARCWKKWDFQSDFNVTEAEYTTKESNIISQMKRNYAGEKMFGLQRLHVKWKRGLRRSH